jgi:exodeoxyribonuclease VII small subunit
MNDQEIPKVPETNIPNSSPQTASDSSPEPTEKPKRSRKKSADTQPPADNSLDFEQSLRRLEAIVTAMETGKLNLDDCLKKFEEGTLLANYCSARLAETERKVQILLKNAPPGEEWQPFEPDID